MVDQRERFVRDDFFEPVFGRAGTRNVCRSSLRRNMIDPMPAQCVIIDLEFPRGSLDRRSGCKEPLDPCAFDMIATLTVPGSRTLLSCHLMPPEYFFPQRFFQI